MKISFGSEGFIGGLVGALVGSFIIAPLLGSTDSYSQIDSNFPKPIYGVNYKAPEMPSLPDCFKLSEESSKFNCYLDNLATLRKFNSDLQKSILDSHN